MTVWIVEQCENFEGCSRIGVFSSRERAEAYALASGYDGWEINEEIVDPEDEAP